MSVINDKNYIEKCEKYYLKPGYIYITEEPSVIYTVLGSCVSVCLYDKRQKIGGVCHYLLPKKRAQDTPTTKWGDIAITALYNAFIDFNSQPSDLLAQIVGGAYLEGNASSQSVASDNVQIARKMLKKFSINIISEDTGGTLGRKILYYSEVNEIMVCKVQKLRATDYNVNYENN